MEAFATRDPSDGEGFDLRWAKVLADASVIIRTILYDGDVAGHVLALPRLGQPEISYWIGKFFWGRGIALVP